MICARRSQNLTEYVRPPVTLDRLWRMDRTEDIVMQACDLLRTYRLALNAHGAEITELADQRVPDHTIAALYPYDAADWSEAYDRLTLLPGMPRAAMIHPPRFPAGLNTRGWEDVRALARSLDATSPYLDGQPRITYGHLRSKVSLGHEPFKHLELLVMLLHILATSPEAPKVAAALAHQQVDSIFSQARETTGDPKFWPPVPQPSSD